MCSWVAVLEVSFRQFLGKKAAGLPQTNKNPTVSCFEPRSFRSFQQRRERQDLDFQVSSQSAAECFEVPKNGSDVAFGRFWEF